MNYRYNSTPCIVSQALCWEEEGRHRRVETLESFIWSSRKIITTYISIKQISDVWDEGWGDEIYCEGTFWVMKVFCLISGGSCLAVYRSCNSSIYTLTRDKFYVNYALMKFIWTKNLILSFICYKNLIVPKVRNECIYFDSVSQSTHQAAYKNIMLISTLVIQCNILWWHKITGRALGFLGLRTSELA